MSKSRFREISVTSLAILLTVAAAKPVASFSISPVIAQSSNLPMPTSVPSGTTIDIDGSSSMTDVNQTLKQRFENRFPDTVVQVNSGGNDAALQALREGKIDLAAIGRPLTAAEKTEGLVVDPLSRPKIAIVVGNENPFQGSLTTEQFAKIFRGEITDWSEVGGTAGTIRLIDRPETNDTRQAFQTYPVFQEAPFTTGSTARQLSEDSTESVVKELGKDGISYAIVDQVKDQSGVRIVSMHDTLPSDTRYPFSQPLSYVYQGPEPNADVRAFLGYIADPQNQLAVAVAPASEVPTAIAASPQLAPPSPPPAAVSATAAPITTDRSNLGALWWLAIPVLGGLLWWLLKRDPSESVVSPVVSPLAAAKAVPDSRIILVPRSCKAAYAYWEVPEVTKETLRRQGRETLTIRLYDVTDIDLDTQEPHSVQQFECDMRSQDHHLPIPLDNRDYITELGYLETDGSTADRWIKLARSAHVRVPACPVPSNIPNIVKEDTAKTVNRIENVVKPLGLAVTGATVAGTVMQSALTQPSAKESRIILTPRNANSLYAYWEVPEDQKAELRRQGGQKMVLRLSNGTHDVNLAQPPANSVQEYECSEQDSDMHIPIPTNNHNYVAELGYVTDTGRWLGLTRSASVQVPELLNQRSEPAEPAKSINPLVGTTDTTIENTVIPRTPTLKVQHYGDFTPGDAATVQSYGDFTPDDAATVQRYGDFTPDDAATVQRYGNSDDDRAIGNNAVDSLKTAATSPAKAQYLKSDGSVSDRVEQNSRIILVPRSAKTAYAYWEISPADSEAAKRQDGTQMILRVYEVTNIDMDDISAHSVQQFECNEQQQDRPVTIPLSDRDYVAEIGYVTVEGRWLSIIRSLHVRIPAA